MPNGTKGTVVTPPSQDAYVKSTTWGKKPKGK